MAAKTLLLIGFGGTGGHYTSELRQQRALGISAQDPSLAQHVPCTDIINIGPITRPCIDTILCNPGTTSGHLVTSREDECTNRLQGDDRADTT